ncbi:MFS general substrate transporter [Thozetella sp. PMI_491]|nr:MFS general substrate transporter [Thozetella sp. PMI_491]
MLALDTTSIAVALPTIAAEMQASERAVFSMGIVFALVATVFQQPVAEISHVLGRKPAVLLTLSIFFFGSVVAAVGDNMTALIIGRGMQGFGSAGAGLSNLILTDILGLRQRAAWMPVQNLVWAVGLVCGPVIGAALVKLSWRWLFWVNLAPIAISGVGLAILLGFDQPEGGLSHNLRRVDWVGMGLFTFSAVWILLPIAMGGVLFPWNSIQTIFPLVLGFCGMVTLVCHQRFLAPRPMFRASLFVQWTAVSCYTGQAVLGLCMNMVFYFIVVFWTGVRHFTTLEVGLALLPQLVCIPTAAIIAGLVVRSTGCVGWALRTGWPMGAISCGMLWFMDTNTPLPFLVIINASVGLACGMVGSSLNTAVMSVSMTADQGHAMAMGGLMRSAGTTVGLGVGTAIFSTIMQGKFDNIEAGVTSEALLQLLRDLKNDPHVVLAIVDVLRILWVTCAGLCAVAAILAWTCRYPNLKLREQHETEENLRRNIPIALSIQRLENQQANS